MNNGGIKGSSNDSGISTPDAALSAADPDVTVKITSTVSADGDSAADPDVTVKITGNVEGTPTTATVKLSDSGRTTVPRPGARAFLRATSTQFLSQLIGRKRRSVDSEIESAPTRASAAASENEVDELDFVSDMDKLRDVHENYDIRRMFAEGGQGIVSLAVDQSLHRQVALKSLRKELSSNTAARENFVSEARVTAALDHPAIIPVYSLNTDDGNGLHLAMKLLRGKSLKEYLEQISECYRAGGAETFDEDESLHYRLDIFLRVCDAMSYVHTRGIIHCDLKPENIMVGEFREAYIMDWGIAKKIGPDDSGAHSTKVMGTPRYTSPENLNGRHCDARSDIYTMGVILYELVTLQPAFTGNSAREVVQKVRTHTIRPVFHHYGCKIARDLAAIIEKATAFAPDDRYQSMKDFADDIREYLRGGEVAANPDGWFGKILRRARRHRKAVVATVLAVLVLSGSAAVTVTLLNIARSVVIERERDHAVATAYAAAFSLGVDIDRQFSHIANLLGILNSEIALMLSSPTQPNSEPSKNFVAAKRLNAEITAAGRGLKMPYSSTFIDLDRVSYISPEALKPAEINAHLSRLAPLFERMRLTVFRSSAAMPRLGVNAGRKAYVEQRLPVRFAYFSLNDGFYADFPGNNDYPPDYDGRKRKWFLSAVNRQGRVTWGRPYHDVGGKRNVVVTCSMEIIGADHNSHGVSALDIPMHVMTEAMCGSNVAAAGVTVSRQLIGRDGRVIVEVRGNRNGFSDHPAAPGISKTGNDELALERFEDLQLFHDMLNIRYGTFSRMKNGREYLYVFTNIPTVDWMYVEKIDFTAQLAAKKHQPLRRYLAQKSGSLSSSSRK